MSSDIHTSTHRGTLYTHSLYIHTHTHTQTLSQTHTLTHTDTLRCFINERDFCLRMDPQHTACRVPWFTVNHVLPAANYLHSCWFCLSALRYATHLFSAKCFMWPDSLTTGRLLEAWQSKWRSFLSCHLCTYSEELVLWVWSIFTLRRN